MDFMHIIKTAGSVALTATFSAAAPVLTEVNQFLPSEHKLPENANGQQVQDAVNELSPDQQMKLKVKLGSTMSLYAKGFGNLNIVVMS